MPRVFISHAAKDAGLAEDFVDLLQLGINIMPQDVFCSSLPGMDIPTGSAFVRYIKSQIGSPEIVVLLVSHEFLKSQFCNAEVGASWALDLPIWPLLVPPVGYADVRGVLDGTQFAMIDNKEKLNDMRDHLTKTLKLEPFGTTHWERKRDRFLGLIPKNRLPAESEALVVGVAEKEDMVVVITSDAWIKFNDRFLIAEKFERRGSDKIHVELTPVTPEDEASFNRLRSSLNGFHKDPIPFAYQNDGGFAEVIEASSVSKGGRNVWTFELTVEEIQTGHWSDVTYNSNGRSYTPDDVAKLKAGRILIGEPPKPEPGRRGGSSGYDFLESFLGNDSRSKVKTDHCLIQQFLAGKLINQTSLQLARLEVVHVLKSAGIVDDILELSLGPLSGEQLPVKFRGARRSRYAGQPAETIGVSGVCHVGNSGPG